jgi:Pterin 4 alpha carbinolamine dehydratase
MGEHVGLTSRRCRPVDELALLDENIRERLRQQVPGWRITALPGGEQQCIRQDWTASDADAAAALLARLHGVAESQGHAPVRAEAVGSTVILELSTPAVGAHACTHARCTALHCTASTVSPPPLRKQASLRCAPMHFCCIHVLTPRAKEPQRLGDDCCCCCRRQLPFLLVLLLLCCCQLPTTTHQVA